MDQQNLLVAVLSQPAAVLLRLFPRSDSSETFAALANTGGFATPNLREGFRRSQGLQQLQGGTPSK